MYCWWRGCRLVRSAMDTSDGSQVSKTEYLEDFHIAYIAELGLIDAFMTSGMLRTLVIISSGIIAVGDFRLQINKVNIGEQCKATRESRIHSIEGMDNAQNWHDSTAKNVIFIIALVVAWRNRGHSNFFAEGLHDATKHLVSETGHVPKNYVSHSYLCFHDPAIEFEKNSLCPSESMVLTTGLPCYICTEAKDRIKKINSPNNIRHL
ncbi:unnamed protein product, partial [Eretmochelys imbricata]